MIYIIGYLNGLCVNRTETGDARSIERKTDENGIQDWRDYRIILYLSHVLPFREFSYLYCVLNMIILISTISYKVKFFIIISRLR